jgi:hypothetical protein
LGGDGDTGFPETQDEFNRYGIDYNNFGRIKGIKNAYTIWNNHTHRNDFDLFWREIYSKYKESGLSLQDYTKQCIADTTHEECQPIQGESQIQYSTPARGRTSERASSTKRDASRSRPRYRANEEKKENVSSYDRDETDFPEANYIINLLRQDKPNSIFDKLKALENGISSRTTNKGLFDFLKEKYNMFMETFGQNSYPLFERVLLRWKDYPVPIDLTAYLAFYTECYNAWNNYIGVKDEYKNNIEIFDRYYELYENGDLKVVWGRVHGNMDEYLKGIDDFNAHIQAVYPEVLKAKRQTKKKEPTKTKTQAQAQPLFSREQPQPQQPSSIQGCASREPPQYSENAVKTYNKLINCLDVGKDATSTSQSLNATEHGNFMLNNVINPLFGYNNIPESITDKYNFNGVGDKSIALYNDIIRLIDPTITNIPIYKHIVPELFSYQRYLQELRQSMPQIHEPGPFYIIQDAGYAPRFIFQNYDNLFTFATILDTASFTTNTNDINLTKLPLYQIKQDILEKYSLNTCIKELSFKRDSTGNYNIHFDLNPNGTIDEYFNTSYNPMAADGTELFNRMSRSAAPIDAAQPPPFYTQGNYNKNYYIRENYTDQRRLLDIQKLVLIKEMGDTLKAMLLDQLLSYTEETLSLYPDLAANQGRLPFCRENCIVTTNDGNLAMRCLLNKINSIVTSGRNVTKMNFGSNGLMDVAAPFYRIESDAEIRGKVEQLKLLKIQNLVAQNNEVINLLVEIADTDGMAINFEGKSINEIQREHLKKYIDNDQKQINSAGISPKEKQKLQTYLRSFKEDYENPDPLNFQLRRKFLGCLLRYMATCLHFINERIAQLFTPYKTTDPDPGYTVEDLYKSFLNELVRFKFECPFEKYVNDSGQTFYIYSPNDVDNGFCFLPKLYGIDKMENFTNAHEPPYHYYRKEKMNYTDFSLVQYFKIADINDMCRTVFENGTIGSIYKMFNVRLEKNNFTPDQLYGIINMNDENYFAINPSLYYETLMEIDAKDKIFNKCIRPFSIGNLIYTIGCGDFIFPDNQPWIRENDNQVFRKEVYKLKEFSQLLDPYVNITNCLFGTSVEEIDIETRFNSPLSIKEIIADYNNENDEFFDPSRKNNIIEDTLVFDDFALYPSPLIAKYSYLNKEISQFIQKNVEGLIKKIYQRYPILLNEEKYTTTAKFLEKLHFIMANLKYELKMDLQMKVANYIANSGRSPITAPESQSITLKDGNIVSIPGDLYTGRLDDTALHIDFWGQVPTIDNVVAIEKDNDDNKFVKIGPKKLVQILGTTSASYRMLLDSKYDEIVRAFGNQVGGDREEIIENADPVTAINAPSFADKVSGTGASSSTDLSVFEQTIFQKYFQNVGPAGQKPGLLTFHMLCYFPKIIFMVYSLLKYIEADPQLQTLYNASYAPLKDILVKFYERDFSDELNRIFHDMVGTSVDPTYEDEGPYTIDVLANYDNATALIIDIAQQMYNVAGLFKMGEEKFKADLALFNTHVLKKEPAPLFLKIAENENKHDIEYLYGRLFDAEYYVCETKGLYKKDDGTYGKEFNSIRVFEKFLANGVYSYGSDIVAEADAVAEAETVKSNIPQKVVPGAPKKEDVSFLAKMLGTLGLGKEEEEEEPMPIRKLNFASTNVNENPTAPVYGGAKKTRKRSSSAKRYKKTRKNPKHRA